jgi:hypothetical protein
MDGRIIWSVPGPRILTQRRSRALCVQRVSQSAVKLF